MNLSASDMAARIAFDLAIRQGRLSDNCGAANYAGDYMFMGRNKGVDHFKHRDTRQYLAPLADTSPDTTAEAAGLASLNLATMFWSGL